MNRRTFIQSTATGVAGLAAGTLLLNNSTDSAIAAVTIGDFTMQGDSLTTADGNIGDVNATVKGNWQYELPGGSPQKWLVSIQVSDGDVWQTIGEDTGTVEYAMMDGSYEVTGSLVANGPFDNAFFAAPSPGKSTVTELPFQVWFRVLGTEGTKLADAKRQDTATITVSQESINATQYGEVDGSGSLTIAKQ